MRWQGLDREVWSGGSLRQAMRRDEQKPDMRQIEMGETASLVKALGSQAQSVDPARVHLSCVCLSREIPAKSGKSAEVVVPPSLAGRTKHKERSRR
jgi:hypothetical protein